MTPSETALPDLGELRRLAEAATPGPWVSETMPDELHLTFTLESAALGQRNSFGDAKRFISGTSYNYVGNDSEANIRYIAAAHPQAVLALLNRHESALGRLRVLETGHTAVVHDLRVTNQRLNRRCQQAEAAATRSADSVKAELYGRRKGKPLGRMLANIRLTELEAAADALAGACEAAAHSGYSATSKKIACPLCGFHPDEHADATEECLIAAALAAYRAVRSQEATK